MRDKIELRKILRKARKDFVLERQNSDISVPNSAVNNLLILISDVKSVSGYAAITGEPDVMSLLVEARGRGVATALPYIDPAAQTRDMVFAPWAPGDPLTESENRFLQPISAAAPISPDIILAPLLGFDRAFNRLGQGAGDYDRAFARYPDALRIGIAWSVQRVESLPLEPWDVPLDAILTEREWIQNPAGRL